jgi:hypothetical protein
MKRSTKKRPRRCRGCGCTDADCRQCVERTGEPCEWVEPNLCSACADGALLDADAEVEAAEAEALAALVKSMKPGRWVVWLHGRQYRSGEVLGVSAIRYQGARLRVRSTTGRTYWLDAWNVVSLMKANWSAKPAGKKKAGSAA